MAATDVWICCGCGATNLTANADRCPLCSHDKCGSCTTGRPGLHLGLSEYTLSGDRQLGYISGSSLTDDVYYRRGTDNNINGIVSCRGYDSEGKHPQSCDNGRDHNYTGGVNAYGHYTHYPPDMTGWWICCECQQANNPQLAPSRCPSDGHVRSICCTTL